MMKLGVDIKYGSQVRFSCRRELRKLLIVTSKSGAQLLSLLCRKSRR